MKRLLLIVLVMSAAALQAATPMGNAFSYQGRLVDGTTPASGYYDFMGVLFDAPTAGKQVSLTAQTAGVNVVNGLFTASFEFAPGTFQDSAVWLEVSVRPNGTARPYVLLGPRQRINPAPQAQFAALAARARSVEGDLSLEYPYSLSFGMRTRQMVNLWDDQYGIGVQANVLYQRTHGGFGWFKDGVHSDLAYNPGGGTAMMTLDSSGSLTVNHNGLGSGLIVDSVSRSAAWLKGRTTIYLDSNLDLPHLRLEETQDDDFARLEFKSTTKPVWHIAAGGNNNFMNFWNKANGDVMSLSQDGNLYVKVLTITGGADVAEPFEMSKEIPHGAVVVIDDENPGKLRLSDRAYDTRVAGVVSGANGVKPGLSLCQQGTLEGGQQVALTGRVYVQAEASGGPIKPGDLLTTSGVPGYAMKVGDHTRAQGAVLGKAMTGLQDGKGMVLVLVTLQ